MAGRLAYLDASAFVKLIVAEPESAALRRAMSRWPDVVSAALLRTESVRALRRSGNERYLPNARRLLRHVHLIGVDEPVLERAAELGPPSLRTLDAIHLAAALEFGTAIGLMFVYDSRLSEAAEGFGFAVASPA